MTIFPNDLYTTLEFDKVLVLAQEQCLGAPGQEAFENLELSDDHTFLKARLQEVFEFRRGIDRGQYFPLSNYPDLSEELHMLGIEGYVLPEEGLRGLAINLRIIRDVFRFFATNKDALDHYPAIYEFVKEIKFDEALLAVIDRVIDNEGNVRPDASSELMRLRRMTNSKRKELDGVFRNVINKYLSKGWLTDNMETFRNGRRVLSVPAEHKRSIRGIIHDESASGRTCFIEPEEVIDINNDIFDLEHEEKREIYRILRDVSEKLRPSVNWLRLYQQLLVRLDVIQAKAHLAGKLKCDMPQVIHNKPHYKLERAVHPLLYLKNQRDGKKTMPFDLKFMGQNRILLLSGPNAGGKSICMKSLGLIQLMFQAGMLIPVGEGSEIGIVKKIYADIGDQQSLEDELSTYSSRLKNAKHFLADADADTLILIDEFGSGTDPKAGGAIAESILRELNNRHVWGVITTHYSNLKLFAFKNAGIVNGAMVFNKDTLSPTYEMKVGRPGSSYAFEIARKTGLDQSLLGYAERRMGEQERNLDELLIDLQREKQEASESREKMELSQKNLDRLIATYESMRQELELGRKKLKLQEREQKLAHKQGETEQLAEALRELRKEADVQRAAAKAAELLRQQQEEQEQMYKVVEEMQEEVYVKLEGRVKGEIKEGAHVILRGSGVEGVVESIKKNEAVVLTGSMKITTKLKDIELVNAYEEPVRPVQQPKVQFKNPYAGQIFEHKLDIRGMRIEEAMTAVEEFVDRALLGDVYKLEIVHGHGTGALRDLVRKKLRGYNGITFRAEENNNGVTVIEL